MRIALVILHADASRGGAERYTLDLAAALARDGHDVALLATSFDDAPSGVACVELSANGITRTGRYRRMLDSLDTHLSSREYDIIHAMLPVRRCDVYHPHAGIALAALDQPAIRFKPRRKAMAIVERDLLAGPDKPVVLCLSDYVQRSVTRYYSGIEHRLATLFNAVDLDRFQPAARSDRADVRALFVGHDFERKGLRETLDALKRVRAEHLKLMVVGSEARSSYPSSANVSFAGEAADPRPFYRDADFLVLPTKHDPCSLVVLEALAMGVPVISTRFNGACEIMTDGVHGFVLEDPTDVEALSAAMRKMLDSDLRARMSRACLDLRPRLSYEQHLGTLLGIYRQVLQSRGS